MLNLSTIRKALAIKRDYCVVVLKGKMKGELIERDHILPCLKETSNEMNDEVWLKLIGYAHEMDDRQRGTVINEWEGEILNISYLDRLLNTHLTQFLEDGDIFPLEIKTDDDVCDRFLVFRSLHRDSSTRALNQDVSLNDIDAINS